MHIRIGTRTSLMAMTQANIVQSGLKNVDSSITSELVGILSLGDRDVETPLPEINSENIFSGELDMSLLNGKVDCAVHSLKDLGTESLTGLTIAAYIKRDDPRDLVLFNGDIEESLKKNEKIVIGTSAPRRDELIPAFLSKAFPQYHDKPYEVCTVPLRGNVTTRIEKLKNSQKSDQRMHGIALALGGLERLYLDDCFSDTLRSYISDFKIMVMPLTICPTAPGQGTICVKVREDRPDVMRLFKNISDDETKRHVVAERSFLKKMGGGCHQRFGATQFFHEELDGDIFFAKGRLKNDDVVDMTRWSEPKVNVDIDVIWDGHQWRNSLFETIDLAVSQVNTKACFVTHARALPGSVSLDARVWTSGVQSWIKLASQQQWVEGCADSLGFDFIKNVLKTFVLDLPDLNEWSILTHEEARGWEGMNVVATYRLMPKKDCEQVQNIIEQNTYMQADVCWWGSYSQYEYMKKYVTKDIIHACGSGRTARLLKEEGVEPLMVFPSYRLFNEWIKKNYPNAKQLTP